MTLPDPAIPLSTSQKAAVGCLAPDITLIDPRSQEPVRLGDFRGKDVMLVFQRGTWCPFCREQLQLLAQNHERLAAAGIVLLGALCQGRSSVARYLAENPLPFPLLVDEKRAAARAMGTHYWLTYEGFNLSHPALFILDREGRITFRHVGQNMRDLPVTSVIEKFLGYLSPE